MTQPEETIPESRGGVEVNVEEGMELPSQDEATRFFVVVKDRLLAINKWKDWAGALSAGFQLTDAKGKEINTIPKPGNYVKIDIPAPGTETGDGHDWVRIEDVKEEKEGDCEFVSMRVRPAPSPVNENKDVAHFYTDEATSNFIVKREGIKVTAGVYGRNEKPNVKADTVIDKIRNAVVGTGAVTAFSKIQWKALVSGLLERKI